MQANKFRKLPLGQVRPTGWLYDQLRIQADGMSGNLDLFWPDVKDSSWFGGEAEGWERATYWLDGVIPLAYLLKDEALIRRVDGYIDYIVAHQCDDGWLGSKSSNTVNPEAKDRYDIWGQFLAVKMLVEYYEINPKAEIIDSVERALLKLNDVINWTPLFDWGQARWFEALIAIFWLHEKRPAQWLLDLAVKLESQGFNWKRFLRNWPMTAATPKGGWNFMSHVVNNAMAVKAYGLTWKLSQSEEDRAAVYDYIAQLDAHHGTAVGTFTGDECLAGKEPIRGTELCAAVEYMYSLEQLVEIFGDLSLGDRLEKIAFNALPGYFTRDMWAHQYNQQVNQISCTIDPLMPWNTNDPDANIYGLMPHFGCCTSNYHQGFPKFTAHAWLQEEGGLVALSYAPVEITTEINGVAVKIGNESDYPFTQRVRLSVEVASEVEFSLRLRNPEWSKATQLLINGKIIEVGSVAEYLLKRTWSAGVTVVELLFSAEVKVEQRFNNAAVISHGALIYALPLEEQWQQVNQDKPYREFPHCDYEVRPTSAWNWAINHSSVMRVKQLEVTAIPFSRENPPCVLTVTGAELPEWQSSVPCLAADMPQSPVAAPKQEQELTLIPFGCTHLRMGELPWY